MGTLGNDSIVMVFNKDYAKVKDFPFDLRSRRAAGYHYDATANPGDQESELAKTLETSLRDIFTHSAESVGEVMGNRSWSSHAMPRRTIAPTGHAPPGFVRPREYCLQQAILC